MVATALAAERAGPFVGALIACLPVSAGPGYVLLALQSSDAFIADSALTSTAAVAATGLFLLAYTYLGPRHGLLASLAGAYGAWLAAAIAIRALPWTAAGVVALNAVVFGVANLLARIDSAGRRPRAPRRWYDLPLQAALIGGLTAIVITVV